MHWIPRLHACQPALPSQLLRLHCASKAPPAARHIPTPTLCPSDPSSSSLTATTPHHTFTSSFLQLCFEHYSVPPADRFTFTRFMEGPVARLVRKPVRIALTLDTLRVGVFVFRPEGGWPAKR